MTNSEVNISPNVDIIFHDCSLDLAARQLSGVTKLSISVPADCSSLRVNGVYKNQPVEMVIESIARSLGLQVRWIQDNFVSLYQSENEENIILITPAPFLEESKLPQFEALTSSLINGFLIVSGPRDNIRQYVKSVQELNKRLNVSFGCEITLVRIAQKTYLDAAAQFQFSPVNLLAVTDITQLINIFARLDSHFNKSKQVINAFAYLSEGQKSSIEVGSVRQRELKHISSEGYVSTSGYQEFKDGLQLELVCNSISESLYSLNLTITNSKYRDSSDSSDVLPINDTSKVSSNKAILTDNHFALLACVSERLDSGGAELFGISSQDNENVLLVFVRLKRIAPSCFGMSIIENIDIDNL